MFYNQIGIDTNDSHAPEDDIQTRNVQISTHINNMQMQQLPKGRLQNASGFPHRFLKIEAHGQIKICDPSVPQNGENDNIHNCTQNGRHHLKLSHQSPSKTSGFPQCSKKSSTKHKPRKKKMERQSRGMTNKKLNVFNTQHNFMVIIIISVQFATKMIQPV